MDKPTGRDAQGRELFTATDQQRMERYFNVIAQATTATGGEINPDEFRAFAKYSRMAGQDMTPEGLMKLLPLIQQLGGSQTGTAMMTLYRNMIGGVIPSYKLRNWDAMGLLDKSKVEFSGKTDKVKRLLPGAIPIASDLGRDPMAVADKLAAKFKEFGIDTTDSDAVNKQLMSMFGDRTGVGALAQLINFRASFAKETRNYERTPGIEQAYGQLENSDLMKFKEYEKSVMQLKLSIGQNLLPLATQFMGVMKPVSEFFRDHETVSKYAMTLMLVGKAGGGLLETFSVFNRVGYGVDSFFRRTVSGADAAAGAMSRAERQALGLGTGLRGMPKSLQIGLTLGAAWFTLQQILEFYNASAFADKAQKQVQDASEMSAQTSRKMEELYALKGEKVPQREYGLMAKSAYAGLNVDNQLENYLAPRGESLYHKFFAQGTNPFRDIPTDMRNKLLSDPAFTNKVWKMPGDYGVNLNREMGIETASAHLQKQGRELATPGTMLEFRKRISVGDYAQEAKDTFQEALRRAFPASYEQSQALARQLAPSDSAAKNLLGLFDKFIIPTEQAGDSSTKLNNSFNDLLNPAGRLPDAFSRVASSADMLAFRLGGVQPVPAMPSLGGIFDNNPPQPFGGFPGVSPPKGRTFFSSQIPRLDTGGTVLSDGLAMLHARERVYPADVMHGISAVGAESSSENHYNITIHVSGDPKDAARLSDEIVAKMEAKIRELDRRTKSVDHYDRMVAKVLQNGKERY